LLVLTNFFMISGPSHISKLDIQQISCAIITRDMTSETFNNAMNNAQDSSHGKNNNSGLDSHDS
jgi:hypothetical protein